jgi:hypothetical protein
MNTAKVSALLDVLLSHSGHRKRSKSDATGTHDATLAKPCSSKRS